VGFIAAGIPRLIGGHRAPPGVEQGTGKMRALRPAPL
jgi:hypothetical protein